MSNFIRTTRGKVHLVDKKFIGLPKESDFTLQEEILPDLKDGEFLAGAVYLSVDPYMRSFFPRSGIGSSLFGEQVARILESKNSKYPVGKYVIGEFGWRTHTIGCEIRGQFFPFTPRLVTPEHFKPLSLALGMLGMPGNTAYFGFLDLCKPEAGNVVLVTAAGGAVGSHVGQLAKIKGCYVIGVTGTNEKCKWITDELGFDAALNYKSADFENKLPEAASKGVDIFFDNVGGELAEQIYKIMNTNGIIAGCGSISSYNRNYSEDVGCLKEMEKVQIVNISHYPSRKIEMWRNIHVSHFSSVNVTLPKEKNLVLKEVNVFSYKNRWNEAIEQNRTWLLEGKLKYKETITKGFENMPKAFISMLQGGNIGKAIVQI